MGVAPAVGIHTSRCLPPTPPLHLPAISSWLAMWLELCLLSAAPDCLKQGCEVRSQVKTRILGHSWEGVGMRFRRWAHLSCSLSKLMVVTGPWNQELWNPCVGGSLKGKLR